MSTAPGPRALLAATFRELLGPGSCVAIEPIGGAKDSRRQSEFAAGRRAAAAALREAGSTALEVGVGPGREPLWPRGLTGSITHADCWAAAAVIPDAAGRTVGIDFESTEALDPDLAPFVLGPREASPSLLQTFVAKEAAFKAQFPVTRLWLEFTDVTLEWQDNCHFTARVGQRLLVGRTATPAGFTLAACRLATAS